MLVVASRIAAREGLDEGGYRLVVNNGPDAGQEVPHLHMHILGGGDAGPDRLRRRRHGCVPGPARGVGSPGRVYPVRAAVGP